MAIATGTTAPDFALKGTQGEEPVQLSSFRGDKNVVLLFYPFAFSPVCTTEMCDLRDSYQQYGKLDATVLGISIDSPFAQAAWAQQEKLPFDLLSDFNKEVAPAYDVFYEELGPFKGVSKRAAFVVDKQGIVRYSEECPTPKDLPDFSAIQACLQSLG